MTCADVKRRIERQLSSIEAEVREARRIVDACYTEALATLRSHRDSLERITRRLLEKETLNEEEAYDAAGLPQDAFPTPSLSLDQD